MKATTVKYSNDDTVLLDVRRGYKGIYNRYIKRVFDFILAITLLVVLSPLFIFISVLIVCESGFPILYKADRGGYRGKSFRIYKFRTMIKDADKIGGGTTALNDSRITRIGSFLRKVKLDEITQLINIVKGEMSFVGPRPELLKYTSQYTGLEEIILKVRPGITDYSSLKFINLDEIVGDENADEMYEKYVLKNKNQLRIKYATTVSIQTDIKLFLETVAKVIRKTINHVMSK